MKSWKSPDHQYECRYCSVVLYIRVEVRINSTEVQIRIQVFMVNPDPVRSRLLWLALTENVIFKN